jgi:uncharacterized membrane protein YhaH (DUF805 family)
MSAANPYAAPSARVEDIADASGATQPVKLWSARGRIGRLRWFGWQMIGSLALMPLLFVGGLLSAAAGTETIAYGVIALGYLAFAVFVGLLTIQRAHDLGWSGWAALIVLIPLVGLIFMILRGNAGANRFGAPPPPNPRGMGWAVAVPVVLMVVGIVAAIALPAYQGYALKARAAQSQGR